MEEPANGSQEEDREEGEEIDQEEVQEVNTDHLVAEAGDVHLIPGQRLATFAGRFASAIF
ncbi:MAG: hypothetical protein L0211_18100 [Planctomycetaceae bacterium]|nr:hypothetical protein [Planctomycetaceae bacterium]